jgi:2-C-methyl-D-erythritol 4-phosphate cytidylyltransferase
MSVAALVLAAGRGERLGGGTPKAFVPLAGRPLLWHALAGMAAAPAIERVVPVIARADLPRWERLAPDLAALSKLAAPVFGGAERQDSVREGLAALPPEIEWVAVHDAARPFVREAAVARVVEAARASGAAILAVPATDTIKRVRAGRVLETPPRAELWAAQTPQVFRTRLLREALAKATAEGRMATDDAQLVEWLGVAVMVVEGDPDNWKLTLPQDLAAAEERLRASAARGGGGR